MVRAWIYYRLSRDDDKEMNSLKNQRRILIDYVEEKDYELVGESYDDNVSGMTFERDGIEEIYDAASEHKMDAVIVKDLSRLGRHKTKTAVFIDFLRSQNVRVICVTENTDSFNEDDEFRMDLNQFVNHMYARDVSKKVRAGYRQKQKDKGVCNMPPMGYYKDKNTGKIVIKDEPADIIRKIYSWYLEGYGMKNIAEMLNENGMKSPSYYQKLYNNKNQGFNKPEITFKYLWDPTAVKRVLTNEFYTGTLICHIEETNKANKTRKNVPREEQFRHEGFAPAIISKEVWDRIQALLEAKKETKVRASANKPFHRYTGLLKCSDCGCTFVAKRRKWRDKPERIEYVCNGYHRYKGYCTSHRIREEELDKYIYAELLRIKSEAEKNWKSIENDVKKWLKSKHDTSKKIGDMKAAISNLELEIEKILMERINDKENREIYDKMLEKRRAEINNLKGRIKELQDIDETIKKRRNEIKNDIDLLDKIIKDGAISDTNLRLLVSEILVSEKDNQIQLVISMKASFRTYSEKYGKDGIIESCEMTA